MPLPIGMWRTGLEIPVCAARAWDLLIDTQAWLAWGPSIRAVDAPDRLIGPGMRGRVQTVLGVWLPYLITDWDAGRLWAWQVGGIRATSHLVEPLDSSRCRVSFAVPAWAAFYLPVCRLALYRLRSLAADRPPSAPGRPGDPRR